ncbi:hypothetical protein QA640_45360 (plasmid) [Bradyrhizobium sp. CB82]|uniref:hypothetical protein n=1 Tax=Bradyrhizobium sp. CB82 TaxID=3039159 RepID=UPI0024B234BB|nr:hypothetical protein [Bradyrhizobium sp. CB82]WFU46008.1 hypothetical protein QA640_45360 [Bradyrhizobium sp. CB82]
MTDNYDFQAALRENDGLVEQIRPILARQSPEVASATVAQLLAIFVAAPPLREDALRLLAIAPRN